MARLLKVVAYPRSISAEPKIVTVTMVDMTALVVIAAKMEITGQGSMMIGAAPVAVDAKLFPLKALQTSAFRS